MAAEEGTITRVAGHELFHFIKQNNPKAAQRIQSLVITRLKANPNYDYEGRVAWLRKNNPGADPDEDITAESMFDVLNNKKEVRRLLSEENPSFFEKVKDWIDNFIGFLDDTIKKLKNRKYAGAEIRALEKDKKTLKEIRDLFYQALEETKSVGNTRESGDDVRYSVKEFAEQVDQIEAGTFPRGNHVYVGATPKILADIGLNGNLPMLTTAQHIRKAMLPKNDKTHQHGLTEAQIKALPQKIANPVMIMDSLDPSRNAVIVVTDMMDADGSPIIAAIKADGRGMFNDVEVDANFILSYYGRDGFHNFIEKNISADTFLYIDKTKSRSLSNQAKRQFFGKLDKYDFDTIIRKTNANVNVLNSVNISKNKEQAQDSDNVNKFSIKDAEEQVTEKALLRENDHLKKMVASLKEQMKLTKGVQVKQADIEKLAGRFLREYRSSTDKTAIVNGLKSMFEYIGNDPERNGETAFLMAKNISRDIIENSRLLAPALNEDYAEVRDYLKNTAVYFPQNVRSDIFYNDFRKEMFGRVKIRDTGVPVDAYFNELEGMFPEFGRYDVQSDVQAAEAIADIASRVWTKTTPDGTNVDTMALSLASDIFDAYFDIPQFHSFADKQKAKLNSLKREYRDGKRKLRADLKEKYEGRIGKVKEAYRTRERERIQKEEHDSLVRGIARSVNNLSKRFLYPTDKQNIPIAYRKWVGEVLTDIDVSKIRLDSGSQKNAELQEMMKHIGNMANWRNINLTDNQDSTIDESLEIDPDAKKIRENVRLQIDQLYERNGNRPIDLSAVDNETLKQINNIMQSTLHSVVNYNKVISANKKMTISQMGEKTIADNNTKRGNAFTHALKKIFQIDAASLETYLYGLGDVGTDIWKMFRQGETDKVNCIRSAQSFVESVYADMPKDFRKSLNSKELITYEFKNGSVSFTKQQLMELYALSRRAQAMQHIENGGIITGDITKAVAVTREELNELFGKHLSDVEKDFAVRLQRYLSTEVAKWGNSVTRREFGYDKFTEEFYWPISVDKDTVKTTDKNASEDNVSMQAIRNTGMTKAVNEKATNAIYIHNLMDTFSNHVVEMATYNGYSLVIRDVMGWFNYNDRNGSVKGAIRNAYGSDKTSKKNEPSKGSPGAEYFIKFMKDLNGGQGFDNTTAGNMVDRMASKAKVASVGANLRVIVQQPTAIVRAFDVVEAKYFFPNGKAQKQAESEKMHLSAYEEAARYSTAAQLKVWGFRENGMSTQFSKVLQNNATLKEKVTDVALWGAEKADAVTWGRIWNACKRKITAENPSIDTKSEEFFQMSGKLMDDVCYQTQVFDTLLCRTQNMRSKHSIVRMFTAFTAEPAKSYNMLVRAMMSGSKKKLLKTVSLTTASAILASAAAAFISAGRDDDDYKTFWEKYLETFGGDILDSVNPLSSIPFMSELLNRVRGSDYDTPEFYEQAVENTQSLLDYIYKCFSGETDFDFIKFLDKLSKSVSTLTGIPFSNVLREARTIWNNMPFVERDHKSRTSDYYVTKDSALYDDLLSAMEKGDQDAIDRVKDELIARGKSQKQLNSGLKSVLKEKYEDEVADAAEARQEGNTSRYEQLVNALSKKTGMNVTLVAEAVESVRKKAYESDSGDEESDIGKAEEKKPHLYSMADANRALESNNLSSAQKIIDQEYAYKVDEYLAKGEKQKDAEEKAKSSVRSSITCYWKPLYRAAYKSNNTAEIKRIRELIYATGLYGSKGNVASTVKNWLNNKDE